MLYSSNVHFHGLWSRSSCTLSDQNYFICQAVPLSAYHLSTVHANLPNFLSAHDPDKASELEPICPAGYSLAFYNRSALAIGDKIPSPPHCLQLVSEAPMTWEVSEILLRDHIPFSTLD